MDRDDGQKVFLEHSCLLEASQAHTSKISRHNFLPVLFVAVDTTGVSEVVQQHWPKFCPGVRPSELQDTWKVVTNGKAASGRAVDPHLRYVYGGFEFKTPAQPTVNNMKNKRPLQRIGWYFKTCVGFAVFGQPVPGKLILPCLLLQHRINARSAP